MRIRIDRASSYQTMREGDGFWNPQQLVASLMKSFRWSIQKIYAADRRSILETLPRIRKLSWLYTYSLGYAMWGLGQAAPKWQHLGKIDIVLV